MAIKYLDAKRIRGSSANPATPLHDIDFTEYANQSAGEAAWISSSTSGSNGYMIYDHTNKNLDCRNQGSSAGAKICYYDLGASVNATDWRIRFRYNSSSFSAESTGGKSYYTGFSISNAYDTADTGSPDWFGLKFIADAGSAQSQFYGTDGGSQSGTTMSFSPTSNSGVNDVFVEWHFVSGTCTCKFFTDSDYDTQISGSATVTKSTSVAGLRYFMVYLRQDNGGNGDNEFVVDDFEFINGTESTDEKATLIDSSTYGTASWTGTGSAGSGTSSHDNYVRLPTNPVQAVTTSGSGTAFTIAFWVKSNSGFGGGADAFMGTYDGESSSGDHFQLYAHSSGLKLSDGSLHANWSSISIASISNNSWHHIALTRPASSSTVSAYFDGVLMSAADGDYAGNLTSNTSNSTWLKIGGRGDNGDNYPTMSMQDLGFWTRELVAADIAVLATGKPIDKATLATAYTTNLTGYYKFDGDYTDSSSNTNTGIAGSDVSLATSGGKFDTYVTTNLPENTIFEETDTYSTHWLQTLDDKLGWYWVYQTDFSADGGYTQVGSQVVHDFTTNNRVVYTSSRTDRIWKLLPVPIQGGEDWSLRVKWTHTSTSASGGQYALIYLSNSASDPESSGVKSLGVHFAPYADSIRVRTNDESTKTYGTGAGGSYEGADNWIHLYRQNDTLYIQLYTESTFTTTRGSLVSIAIPNNIKDIKLTHLSFGADSEDSGTFTGYMDDLVICNSPHGVVG